LLYALHCFFYFFSQYQAPPPELVPEEAEKEEGPRLPVGMVLEAKLNKAQKKNLKRKLGKQAAAKAEDSSEAGTAVTDGSTDHTSGFAEADWALGEGGGAGARHGQMAPHEIMGCAKFVSNVDRYKQLLGLQSYMASDGEDGEGENEYDSDSEYEEEEQGSGQRLQGHPSGHILNVENAIPSVPEAGPPAAVPGEGRHLHVTAPQPSAAGVALHGALSSDGSSYDAFPGGWDDGHNGAHDAASAAAAKEEEMVALAMQLSLQEETARQRQLEQQLAAAPAAIGGMVQMPAASMGFPGVMPPSVAPAVHNTAGFWPFSSQAMPVPVPAAGLTAAAAAMPGLFDRQQQVNGVIPGGVQAPLSSFVNPYFTGDAADTARGHVRAQELLQSLRGGAANGHAPQAFFAGQYPVGAPQFPATPAVSVLGVMGGFGAASNAGVVRTAIAVPDGAGAAPTMVTGHGLAEVNMGAGGQQLKVEDVDEDDDEDELQELLGLCGVAAA
jgi:hypothetical protein